MKRLLFWVASTLVMIGCYAQNVNPFFHELREAKRISLSDVDWSNTSIEQLSVSDWAKAKYWDTDFDKEWADGLSEGVRKFILEFNSFSDKTGVLILSNDTDATTELKPELLSTTRRGNMVVKFTLVRKSDGETLGAAVVNGKGGTFGDLSNLQGDGWNSVGKNLAKQTIAQ